MNKAYCVRLGSFVNNDRARTCAAWISDISDAPRFCGSCRHNGSCDGTGRPTSVSVERSKEFAPSNSLDFWGMA